MAARRATAKVWSEQRGGDPLSAADSARAGLCSELLPERITLDDWGYPIIDPAPLPSPLQRHARRAIAECPVRALRYEATGLSRRVAAMIGTERKKGWSSHLRAGFERSWSGSDGTRTRDLRRDRPAF